MPGVGEVLRKVGRFLSRPAVPLTPRLNARCPICGAPVAIEPTTHASGNMVGSPMASPATDAEKRAACALHGRHPFNEKTVEALSEG